MWLLAANAARTGDAPPVRAWLEARSERAAVTLPIVDAQRTEIAFGVAGEEGMRAFAKGEAEAGEELFAAAQENAAADLASLTPRYERDRRKVIQYAELRSAEPIVASAVLAPKFLSLFKNTLGEKVLLVVPGREVAYVFPQLVTRYREYYPLVFEAYRESAHPVSVEVFEVSASGVRAVGVFDRP